MATCTCAVSWSQICELVWCVKSEGDYAALSDRLPPCGGNLSVTVFITRPRSKAAVRIPERAAAKSTYCEDGWMAINSMFAVSLASALVGILFGATGITAFAIPLKI